MSTVFTCPYGEQARVHMQRNERPGPVAVRRPPTARRGSRTAKAAIVMTRVLTVFGLLRS